MWGEDMWTQKIELGQWAESIVSGFPTRAITYKTVYANKKSIRQSEFYMSSNVGLKPELMFEIHSHEYADTEVIRYPIKTGKVYSIVRTYEKEGITEVFCAARVGT